MADKFISRRRLFGDAAVLATLLASNPGRALESSDAPLPGAATLQNWISQQQLRSIEHLLRNISSQVPVVRNVEAKHIEPDRLEAARAAAAKGDGRVRLQGDRLIQTVIPAAGSVRAADEGTPAEPDYSFHWLRDSSLVMREIVNLLARPAAAAEGARAAAVYGQRLTDYVRFSRQLQLSSSTVGFGEARYNLDGTQDFLQWSRPQYDGPALRALTLLHYRSVLGTPRWAALGSDAQSVLMSTLEQDLDDTGISPGLAGFDLWEEYNDHDFHARTVQLGAMQAAADWAHATGDAERASRSLASRDQLVTLLEQHWLPEKGYYGFQSGPSVYWDGKPRQKPGDNFDAAVVMAAVHSRLSDGRGSLLDDRILACMAKAEDLFIRLYPINAHRAADEGVLYGRYEGDDYYGGNPFVFITLEFAEAHYRLAALLAARRSYLVTPLNLPFLERATQRVAGSKLGLGDVLAVAPRRRELLRGLVMRGDDILRTVRRLTPDSGEMPEQYNMKDGSSASARNVSWSHSSFLAAVRAREAVASV